ncbi:MAG: AAA family ATPase [Deltaproteobacteria bacterium]|jgi:hypothetical protein|nr:AAA family ATPase [Deltaproteobacteria bacterium]
MDEFSRFVMATVVTRYAMTDLCSGLDQLVDIGFTPEFAAIRGFTPNEMDQYFADRYSSTLKYLKSTGACRRIARKSTCGEKTSIGAMAAHGMEN